MPRQEIKKTSAFGAGFLGGAKDGIRTRDPDLGKVVLYLPIIVVSATPARL